jgi:hypothetical protein
MSDDEVEDAAVGDDDRKLEKPPEPRVGGANPPPPAEWECSTVMGYSPDPPASSFNPSSCSSSASPLAHGWRWKW